MAGAISRGVRRRVPRQRLAFGALGLLALLAGLWATLLNEVALLGFIGVTSAAVVQDRSRRRTPAPAHTARRPLVAAGTMRGSQP